jgi:Flp pilus assembly protein TadD
LGILVYRKADYSGAVSYLQESARQKSGDAELMYYLGMVQYHLKNRTESKTDLQKALDLNLSGAPAVEAKRVLAELK